ncbi:pyridine nucleotide-disulfide oxidoreductase [bacterium]|nr:MAG: pyridine nucleotide-disulfide oxidoreductase [bacterium]
MIERIPFLIIGGGPAGLSAAITATRYGVDTILIDDGLKLGGQLTKQTHKFFGSQMERAGTRGMVIGEEMVQELQKHKNFFAYTNTTAAGYYPDGVVTAVRGETELFKFKPDVILVATGASEKMITFPGNDLPGVYGAGAVQTLMNEFGVLPGERVLMVGAGNIGLIVSYQLMQAGVKVAGVVEAMDHIGGYWVHASKIRRLGIPILTGWTILKACGDEFVESAIIARVDKNWQIIPESEVEVEVDTICLAVGLSPTLELLFQAGVKMKYVPELGGDVPLRDDVLRTSMENIYVAGDSAGIEEASSAMLEGQLVGIAVAKQLNKDVPDYERIKNKLTNELETLRAGPLPEMLRKGLKKVITKW